MWRSRYTPTKVTADDDDEHDVMNSISDDYVTQICIKYSPDAVPPIHDESYHVATDKDPPSAILAASSAGLFLATIYNQSQLAERKHVARYWSISAVPVSAQPPPLVITTKLAAAILVVAVVSS